MVDRSLLELETHSERANNQFFFPTAIHLDILKGGLEKTRVIQEEYGAFCSWERAERTVTRILCCEFLSA